VRADDRERASGAFARLTASGRVDLRVERRATGDYAFGPVGIERKSATDFALSIIDGRLFWQAARLTGSYARPVVIVEALPAGLPVQGVPVRAIEGAIVSLAAVFGLPVVPTDGPAGTARAIEFAAAQTARREGVAYARPGWRPRGRRARQMYALQGLPRVGPVRAHRLLERFGSVRAVVMATATDLMEVPEIGRVVARAIVESVS